MELFAPWAAVTTKRMFGGAGVYRDGRIFALIADDQIYLKANDVSRPAFEAAGCKPFVFETKGGQGIAMSYWAMPPEALDDSDRLIEWADRAWAAAAKARPPAKPARARGLTARELAELPLKSAKKPQGSIKKR